MNPEQDGGYPKPSAQAARKSARVSVAAMVKLRRRGHHSFLVQVFDLSREGCKVEFIERPLLDESVWVKFQGLEGLEANVCWIEHNVAGVEFLKPLHPAVFNMIVSRLEESRSRGKPKAPSRGRR